MGYRECVKSGEQAHSTRDWGEPKIGWPVAHLLALAPLDVWMKMLRRADSVRPRYWPRLSFILFTSFVGTVISMHERVLWCIWSLIPANRERLKQSQPDVIVILGYYRSGTTHLQNLLACDQRFITPRWYQCLAGQGYILAWSIIRLILVPFLGRTRPQDSVGFGPAWPGEDDFAMATWGGCSSIAGRHVFPQNRERWQGWHALEDVSDKQLKAWQTLTRRFVYKLTGGKKSRVVVLKSPSHAARVAELDRLFEGRVKFIHLVREPGAVIDSNVRMFHALRHHSLQPLPDAQAVRNEIVHEYQQTESKCAQELSALSEDRWVRVRFKDLRSDPLGVLRTIYNTTGYEFSSTQHAVQSYLGSLGNYNNTRDAVDLGQRTDLERDVCDEMNARYKLGTPPLPSKPLAYRPRAEARVVRGMVGALAMAMICWGAWLLIVYGITELGAQSRLVALIWPVGAVIGISARKASGGAGTKMIGIWCALLTLVLVVTVLFPVSVIIWNWAVNDGQDQWLYHNWKSVREGLSGTSSIILVLLGMLTAYRHASESGPIVPGR